MKQLLICAALSIFCLRPIAAIVSKFSIITPTFKRELVLSHYLKRYAVDMPKEVPELHKIYIVWMDVSKRPEDCPLVMATKSAWKVDVEFIIPPKNDLNYRFIVPKNLETDAVLSLDDDLVLKAADIQRAFTAWKSRFNGTVAPLTGFVERDYALNSEGRLVYVFDTKFQYSMLLTGACFLSKPFLALYHSNRPEAQAIRKFVSANMNAEDIGMNFLVAAFYPTLHLNWISGVKLEEDEGVNGKGLSYTPAHGVKRNNALNEFARVFGKNPLNRVMK